MKEKTEKIKVNDESIQLIVDLLITEEAHNKIMALGVIINMNWNVKSKRHIAIMEILWYAYFGSFLEKKEPGYKLEYEVGKKICKPMGISKWKDSDHDVVYTTYNMTSKATRFFRKFGYIGCPSYSASEKASSMFTR